MNKETYERIRIEVTVFDQEDVIITSGVIKDKYEGNMVVDDSDVTYIPI